MTFRANAAAFLKCEPHSTTQMTYSTWTPWIPYLFSTHIHCCQNTSFTNMSVTLPLDFFFYYVHCYLPFIYFQLLQRIFIALHISSVLSVKQSSVCKHTANSCSYLQMPTYSYYLCEHYNEHQRPTHNRPGGNVPESDYLHAAPSSGHAAANAHALSYRTSRSRQR